MADAKFDAKVAAMWPHKWAKADNSKRRYRLRRDYQFVIQLTALRASGARCDNCTHFCAYDRSVKAPSCELKSDYYGVQITRLDGLCNDHKFKANHCQ